MPDIQQKIMDEVKQAAPSDVIRDMFLNLTRHLVGDASGPHSELAYAASRFDSLNFAGQSAETAEG